ncbi:fibronectin type III domain-containing protein [Actinosynnema sp. CS-041913]|uniref:fibronectin type III domain-containing protein n=1 Tax=Actinosynnema sp. CS-041913 TaxID=3239917 RepID=UPI003D8DBED6
MERRKLVGWLCGLALVTGAVVVLRNESAPPAPPPEFTRFLDHRVEYVADTSPLSRPTDLTLTGVDRTSLRATWTATGGVAYGAFEVRWGDRTRLVQATETELTDLDADAEVTVEVRAVDGLGRRSEPAVAKAVPRLAHDQAWADPLVQPLDRFDGPEALSPRRWRVFDAGDECLGLRPLNGKRLEVTCDALDLQSNVPLRLGVPAADGAVGRVVLTTDGPSTARGDGELVVALLPEPFHDIGRLAEPYPPGSVILHITPYGATFDAGSGLSTTSRVVPVGGTSRPPTPGVRHRWELRVLPDAVVALRDGEALAAAAVAVPWTVARPRLAFHNVRHTQVDTFGVGGAPESPVPASVVPLGPGSGQGGAVELGATPNQRLEGGNSVRVVAAVASPGSNVRDTPITVEFGGRSAPGVVMPPSGGAAAVESAFVYADFPLPEPTGDTSVRLRTAGKVVVNDSHLVVDDGQATTRRALPRVTEREHPAVKAPPANVVVVHETGPTDKFPPGGKARIVVELLTTTEREVAAVKGIEVDLDGQRLAALPTGGAAGGRHEFLVDLNETPAGSHRVAVRVLPVDERGETRTGGHTFDIGPR